MNGLLLGQIDARPLLAEILAQPDLWNRHDFRRTCVEYSAHAQIDDIWLRFREGFDFTAEGLLGSADYVWYPEARGCPKIKAFCRELLHMVGGERLGGVFVTRIPPGGECSRHVDGGHHAERFEKYCVCLQARPDQAFCFDDGQEIWCESGGIFWFRNTVPHWVENESTVDRISLIVGIEREKQL